MNGSRASAASWTKDVSAALEGLSAIALLICPPACLIDVFASDTGTVSGSAGLHVGGQDCHAGANGAHTGDVSAELLKDSGCSHVILGHSERRADHGESSALVNAKAQIAVYNGLIPVICVGETEAERDAGEADTVVGQQIAESIPTDLAGDRFVVAYEPVWAIGTGRTPSDEDIGDMHRHIRHNLQGRAEDGHLTPILYGGSLKPANSADILAIDHVNGGLIGGASLKSEDFLAIAGSAQRLAE